MPKALPGCCGKNPSQDTRNLARMPSQDARILARMPKSALWWATTHCEPGCPRQLLPAVEQQLAALVGCVSFSRLVAAEKFFNTWQATLRDMFAETLLLLGCGQDHQMPSQDAGIRARMPKFVLWWDTKLTVGDKARC